MVRLFGKPFGLLFLISAILNSHLEHRVVQTNTWQQTLQVIIDEGVRVPAHIGVAEQVGIVSVDKDVSFPQVNALLLGFKLVEMVIIGDFRVLCEKSIHFLLSTHALRSTCKHNLHLLFIEGAFFALLLEV